MRPSQPNVTVKRRVSRVESLRNLLFNRGGPHAAHLDAKKMMMKKRARSAEKDKATEKVRSKTIIKILEVYYCTCLYAILWPQMNKEKQTLN